MRIGCTHNGCQSMYKGRTGTRNCYKIVCPVSPICETKEHKMYRLAKNENIFKMFLLVIKDFFT